MYGRKEYLWELNSNIPIIIELLLKLVGRGYTFDQLLQQTGSDWLFLIAVFTVANIERHTVQQFRDTMRPGVYRKYCTYCSILEPIVKRKLQEIQVKRDMARKIDAEEDSPLQNLNISKSFKAVEEDVAKGSSEPLNKKRSVTDLYKNEERIFDSNGFISDDRITEGRNALPNRKMRIEAHNDEQAVAISDVLPSTENDALIPTDVNEKKLSDDSNKLDNNIKHLNGDKNNQSEPKNNKDVKDQDNEDGTISSFSVEKNLSLRNVEEDIDITNMESSKDKILIEEEKFPVKYIGTASKIEGSCSREDVTIADDAYSPDATVHAPEKNDNNVLEVKDGLSKNDNTYHNINNDDTNGKIPNTIEKTKGNLVEVECDKMFKGEDSNATIGQCEKAANKNDDESFHYINTEFLKSEFKCFKNNLLSYMDIILTTNTFPVRLEMIYCLDQLKYADLALSTLEVSKSNGELRILYTDLQRNMYELDNKVKINKMENVEKAMKVREDSKWLENLEIDPFITPGQMATTRDKLEELREMEAFKSEIPKINAFIEDLRIIDGVRRRHRDGERNATEELVLKAHLAAQKKKRLDKEAEEIEIFLNKMVPFFDAQRERCDALVTESNVIEELLEEYNFEGLDQNMEAGVQKSDSV